MDQATATKRWEPKSTEIAAKVIDGEAIIINLTNGFYYALDGAGALVWEGIQSGRTLDAIARLVSSQYDVAVETATRDIHALLTQLVREELVMSVDGKGSEHTLQEPLKAARLTYEPPALEKYGDMAHFFAVDPPLPELDEDAPGGEPS